MEARVQIDEEEQARSYIVGRNGTFGIVAVEAWARDFGSGHVKVDGIGKRGRAIRGGLSIPVEAMDELAREWLKSRRLLPYPDLELLSQEELDGLAAGVRSGAPRLKALAELLVAEAFEETAEVDGCPPSSS